MNVTIRQSHIVTVFQIDSAPTAIVNLRIPNSHLFAADCINPQNATAKQSAILNGNPLAGSSLCTPPALLRVQM